MKEIHAYQNDDGTYRVEVLGVKFNDTALCREITESKIEIPRAKVNITSLPPNDEDEGKHFTITIE